MRVGLVSDTHGRFDPGLPLLFVGCDLIVHAGDVAGPEILHQLAAICAVVAVRGNVDRGALGAGLEEQRIVQLGSLPALVVHALGRPGALPAAAKRAVVESGARIVIYGHSHLPAAQLHEGVLYVNPGSAGPRRFSLPRSAGRMEIDGFRVRVELFDLDRPDASHLAPPNSFTL